ncbi:hypothetical protein ABZ714_30660 [Streptomyces sp. NPDC006798]|uniref:hypothetical protein n=1 Tax=unclassified Streptomyces TaxID=2593676 RepID=UPI00332DC3D2
MRRPIATTLAAGLLLALTACTSYSAEDCQKAITGNSTKTNRPTECKDLSQEDYDLILMHWALKESISEMSQEERDMLDYHDDKNINGSIPGT